jgi:membrane complex biogenesis BtpA family protein
MLHVPALPGAPRSALPFSKVIEQVVRDAESLAAAGAAGLILENFGDAPFFPRHVPGSTIAQLTRLAAEVRRVSKLPLGINVLRNDGCAALAIAHAAEAAFIRVNILCGARVTDQGLIEGVAHDLLRLRRQLAADSIAILADVEVKHSAALAARPLEEEVADLVQRGGADALIVTGAATGSPPNAARLKEAQAAAPRVPVLVGSGITPHNVQQFASADGFIVGSGLKANSQVDQPVDPLRVRAMIEALAQLPAPNSPATKLA